MKRRVTMAMLITLISSAVVFGQAAGQRGQGGGGQAAQAPATDTLAPDIPGVVRGGTKVQVIKEGFNGTEGPIAMPDGSLLFTETNANRILKIDKDNNVTTFLENTNGSNALAFDTKGRLISVQTTAGQTKIGVVYPKGAEAVLSDNFEGKGFGRPNDLVVDKKGGVYFTDPPGVPNVLPPTVYYVPAGGKAMKVMEGVTGINGIQLSRDEKVIYINDRSGDSILALDVQPDGSLTNRRSFAKYAGVAPAASGADGLAIDGEGRVYAATNVGVQVFSPQGQHLGTIPLSRSPQNIAFAGPDKKTLYIVGRGAAFKVEMLAQGFKDRAK